MCILFTKGTDTISSCTYSWEEDLKGVNSKGAINLVTFDLPITES